jgi:hypothetical protein
VFQDTLPLLQKRISRKYEIFAGFSFQFKLIYYRPVLNVPIAEPSPALQFREKMHAQIEDTKLDLLLGASKVDFPITRVFTFSLHFTSLLSQLRAMRPTIEEELDLPSCLALRRIGDRWLCLTRDGKTNFRNGPVDVASIETFGRSLYAIDRRLKVHTTELPEFNWVEVTTVHPTVKIITSGERLAFLSVFGAIFFEDGSSILAQYVDASLGSNVIFGLDELGVVYRVVDAVPHKILLKPFITAIAAAGDYVVCLSTTSQCLLVAPDDRVEELPVGFDISLVKSLGREAVIVGGGKIFVVLENGSRFVIKYSDRVGRVNDVLKLGDDYVLAGSVGPPMKVFSEPIPSTVKASFTEIKRICECYLPDFLLALFDCEPWRTFVLVQARRYHELVSSTSVSELIPYFGELDNDAATEIVHLIIQQGKIGMLTEAHLQSPFGRTCFLRYSADSRVLTAEQQIAALPVMKTGQKRGIDGLSAQLLATTNHQTVVPSLRFKEGKLTAFNCGHVFNQRELEVGLTEVQRLCQTHRYPGTGKYLSDIYSEPPIPAPCPKCMHGLLNAHFRDK